jgi:crotonobetainyl-CoA:carnitine CoA-transferase CaiB-like acyl-CoA transferase
VTFALQGIRILDLTDSIIGPFTTMLLASCGAEVIRIESRLHLGFRRNGPWGPVGAEGIPMAPEPLIDFTKVDIGLLVGPTYAEYNHDKLSITLNMAKPTGRDVFKKLAKISDVVVDNFSFGVMPKWGCDYSHLKEIKEDIIVASLPSFGKGPKQDWTTWGMNLLTMSGFTCAWAHPETPETDKMASGFIGDYIAGAEAATAIMGALLYRADTGKGQHLELSQAEATISVLGPSYLDYIINQRVTPPRGNRHPQFAPYNCYRCKGDDCWCVIAVCDEAEWKQFCAALEHPKWTEDIKYRDMESRLRNADELDENIEKWTLQHTSHQVMKMLQFFGVAAGAVQNNEDVYRDLQLRNTGFMLEQNLPRLGKIEVSGIPVHLMEGQQAPLKTTSVLGAHNDYVFRQLLNLAPEEIWRLEQEKVIY